jgi:predicted nucleic acid-binding protein
MALYLLDTGPLGLLAHDRPAQRIPIQTWIVQEVTAGSTFFLSEVADYEVRRELTRLVRAGQLPPSRLDRLDQLAALCTYLPVSSAAWKRAAEFWADARLQGLPTAGAATLDADALIAAQADEIKATVVTNNPGHLGRWVPVRIWP